MRDIIDTETQQTHWGSLCGRTMDLKGQRASEQGPEGAFQVGELELINIINDEQRAQLENVSERESLDESTSQERRGTDTPRAARAGAFVVGACIQWSSNIWRYDVGRYGPCRTGGPVQTLSGVCR